jgi:hypothetical protein
MSRKQPATYEVGYGRPPVAHQFKRGQSGNPKGRRKGSVSLPAAIAAELRKLVPVQENGERNYYSKLAVAAKQLVNKAAAGDLHALRHLLKVMQTPEWEKMAEQLDPPVPVTSAGDRIMQRLREMRERMQACEREESGGDLPSS